MHDIMISQEQRDVLRAMLTGHVDSGADELLMGEIQGRKPEPGPREKLAFALPILDRIDWDLEGTPGLYALDATDTLVEHLEQERQLQLEMASTGEAPEGLRIAGLLGEVQDLCREALGAATEAVA